MQIDSTRRAFLLAGGVALTSLKAFPATPGCTLTSEQEEGPYYVDSAALRRDITESRPGLPLLLAVKLVNAKTCEPLPGAAFDIWHCDALGVYSGFTSGSPNGGPPPGGPGRGPRQIDATRFLRGVQVTNESGLVEFSTLYPGWYSGRAIHIHMKVHQGGPTGHVAHTGQFFFPEDLTERVARMQPYATRLEVHRTTQSEDMVFNGQHGPECMLQIEKLGKTEKDGYRATATLAIDPEATPAPAGRRPRGI